jgi:hypothetical protein
MINHVLLHSFTQARFIGFAFDWLRWWLHRRFTPAIFRSRPLTEA